MTNKVNYLILFLLLWSQSLSAQITFEGFVKDTLVPYQTTKSGDIDNNGTDDLIIGTIEWDNSDFFPKESKRIIEIYLQGEDGQFFLHQKFRYDTTADVLTIDLVDLGNDGIKELVLGYSNKLAIYTQDESHQFSKQYEYEVYAYVKYVSIGYINNDNRKDIVVVDYAYQDIYIFFQHNNGSFYKWMVTPTINGGIHEPELIDMNHDGWLDILYMANVFWDAPFYVLLNNQQGRVSNNSMGILKEYVNLTFRSFDLGYVNSDSLLDIVATSGGNINSGGVNNPQVNIFYRTEEEGIKFTRKIINTTDIPSEVEIIDMNRDDINDLVTDHNGWQNITVYQQSTTQDFSKVSKLVNYPGSYTSDYSWTFGDFNDDCKPDIFVPAAGSILFYLNTTQFACISETDNYLSEREEIVPKVQVYPNPSYEHIHFQFANAKYERLSVQIFDSYGKLVAKVDALVSGIGVDISHLPSGLYYYDCRDNYKMIANGKIVKM